MSKFKISLPIRNSDIRDHLRHLQIELNLLRNSYRAAGTTSPQGQILVAIDGFEQTNVAFLTKYLGLDKSTISITMSQLLDMGWIQMTENKEDRRYKNVKLTSMGRDRVKAINHEFDLLVKDALEGLEPAEKNASIYGIAMFAQHLSDKRIESIKQSSHKPAKRQNTTIRQKAHHM